MIFMQVVSLGRFFSLMKMTITLHTLQSLKGDSFGFLFQVNSTVWYSVREYFIDMKLFLYKLTMRKVFASDEYENKH